MKNLIWALLLLVPGLLFANMDVDQQTETNIVNVENVDADALNLEEGASDSHRRWGRRWGGWGGWGWGGWGGYGYGGWGYPYYGYSYYPWYYGWGW